MAYFVGPFGSALVTVPSGQKICIQSADRVKLSKAVGYPNQPTAYTLVESTDMGEEYTSAATTAETVFQIEAGNALCYYATGASPSVSTPLADQSMADATGLISGLAAAQGGYVKLVGGTSSTSGNAGGEAGLLGGTPGATGVGGAATVTGGAGGATSGAGGQAKLTGGAGTNGNGSGGSVVLTPGAKNGSGYDGVILARGLVCPAQGAPSAKTTAATLTAAELKSGIITANQGAGAAANYQLPLATDLDTAMPDAAAGDAFDFFLINISTVAAEDITITTNTGWTLVGLMEVQSRDATTINSSGHFRARKTGAGAWTLYRLA